VVLGLDFGGTKIAATVAAMSGQRIGETTVETDPSLGARWNLELGLAAACVLLDDVAPGRDLVAVGASTFGIPAAYGVGLAPAIPGWEELALGHELAVMFDCSTVCLATDVKAAAAAEASSGALVGHDPAIYLNLGTGLAAAIVSGGKVVSGAHGAAGEIGYNLRQPSDVDLVRAEHVVLEEVVSGMGLAASGQRQTGHAMTAAEIFAGEGTDPKLEAVVEQFVRELCFHVANLAVAVDASRIAVGGGMVRSWARIGPPLRRALEATVPFPPDLVVGAYPFDAPLVGVLNLALAAAAGEPSDLGAGGGGFGIDGTPRLAPSGSTAHGEQADAGGKPEEQQEEPHRAAR
jgi:glucokinase